jgi:hypothetical protein
MALTPDVSTPPDSTYTMTAAQQRVLDAMDKSSLRVHEALPADKGTFWQVALGVMGISFLLAGTVLVFFFAALGAVMLVAGGLSFAAALQGASFSNRAAQRLGALGDDEDTEPPTTH